MLRKYKKLKILILVSVFGMSMLTSYSQIGVVDFLNAGVKDAETMFEAYLTPLGKGLGANMTSGWYNTGKPHQLLGFDLTFTFSMAKIPTLDETFDFKDKSFTNLIYDPTKSVAQTVAGSMSDNKQIPIGMRMNVPNPAGGDDLIFEQNDLFKSPRGAEMPFTPLPMIQLGIGLVKNTEVNVRFIPELKFGEFGSVGLWGVGIKHDVLQWLPIVDKIPINVSIQGGYCKMTSKFTAVKYNPTMTLSNPNHNNLTTDYEKFHDGQELDLTMSGFTGNLILSKKVAVITFYGSVGFYKSNFDINLLGKYPLPSPTATIAEPTPHMVLEDENIVTDPINISIPNSNFRACGGLRLNLALITFHFDYTYQDYPLITCGLGISFR